MTAYAASSTPACRGVYSRSGIPRFPIRRTVLGFLCCLFCCCQVLGCAREPGGTKAVPAEATATPRQDERIGIDVAIEQFAVLSAGSQPNDISADAIAELHGRLLAIGFRQVLAERDRWGAVTGKSVSPDSAGLLLSGTISHLDAERIEVDLIVGNRRGEPLLKKHYLLPAPRLDSGAATRTVHPFNELFNSVADDLEDAVRQLPTGEMENLVRTPLGAEERLPLPLRLGACDAQADAAGGDEASWPGSGRSASAAARSYDELLVEAIHNYEDIYFQDLMPHYHDWLASTGENRAALLDAEREAATGTLRGVAAIVEAVLLHVSSSRDRYTPLQLLLTDRRFSKFTHFQPYTQYQKVRDKIQEDLGVSLAAVASPLSVTVDDTKLVLTSPIEEQYLSWRTLIAAMVCNERFIPAKKTPHIKLHQIRFVN